MNRHERAAARDKLHARDTKSRAWDLGNTPEEWEMGMDDLNRAVLRGVLWFVLTMVALVLLLALVGCPIPRVFEPAPEPERAERVTGTPQTQPYRLDDQNDAG